MEGEEKKLPGLKIRSNCYSCDNDLTYQRPDLSGSKQQLPIVTLEVSAVSASESPVYVLHVLASSVPLDIPVCTLNAANT
jgi:hypothetical protein